MYKQIENRLKHGLPLQVYKAKNFKIRNLEISFWSFDTSAWRWRWNITHIDIGFISIYNLPKNSVFWKIIAFLIKPMRNFYHKQ